MKHLCLHLLRGSRSWGKLWGGPGSRWLVYWCLTKNSHWNWEDDALHYWEPGGLRSHRSRPWSSPSGPGRDTVAPLGEKKRDKKRSKVSLKQAVRSVRDAGLHQGMSFGLLHAFYTSKPTILSLNYVLLIRVSNLHLAVRGYGFLID